MKNKRKVLVEATLAEVGVVSGPIGTGIDDVPGNHWPQMCEMETSL